MKTRSRVEREREFEIRSAMRKWLNGGPPLPYVRFLRFGPDDLAYNRRRNALRKLRDQGVDPNWLFRFATHDGITPEAIELVEKGLVAPETIVARNEESTGARAFFLGLAAKAAFLRGDMIGTIRLLRQAYAQADDLCSPAFGVFFIRERASDEQNALLDNARIPRL